MRLPSILSFTAAAIVSLAAAQAPAPGPEYAPLTALVGVWKMEGVLRAMPALGITDAGPVVYDHVNRMINGGFFLETRRTGTGPRGAVNELFLYSYNPATRTYRQDGYGMNGMLRSFTGTIDGRTWSFRGANAPRTGTGTQERFMLVYAADMSSATVRSEHTQNGTDWYERLTGRYTKVASATPVPVTP